MGVLFSRGVASQSHETLLRAVVSPLGPLQRRNEQPMHGCILCDVTKLRYQDAHKGWFNFSFELSKIVAAVIGFNKFEMARHLGTQYLIFCLYNISNSFVFQTRHLLTLLRYIQCSIQGHTKQSCHVLTTIA